ncbi:hypothetical protein OH76DRAFT_1098504 [Lentinus brumalis]|uniref:F-box domain-containing protein n=1 Tax=Lentinus brumalis TaxID=2498619 RepID=A0A371CVW2_9APHY|nr:hypothetical protein OH76DRAFT_1098504 [Polyporus brumalis]
MIYSMVPCRATCLNLDILQTTIDFVEDRSDVLTLSLVSSTVRSMALRRLLNMAPIQLKDELSIRRFHDFLAVDAAARGSHVRALDIWTSNVQEEPNCQELETLLCEILSRTRNLQTLSLPSYVSHLPGAQSDLRVALEGLSTLRELRIDGYDDKAPHTLVEKIRSPIRTLRTGFISLDDDDYCTPSRISAYLSHLIPTLRLLELGTVNFPEELTDTDLFTVTPCTFVHSLNIITIDGTPDLAILLRWFPALESLVLGPLEIYDWSSIDYERVRERNIRSQRDGSWKGIDELICDANTLYVLGLVCPLRRVVVDHCVASSKHHIVSALSDNPPAQLYLSVEISQGLAILEKLVPPQAKDTLTHLTLCLYYIDGKTWRRNSSFNASLQLRSGVLWKVLSASIRHLRLTHLRVVFHCDIRGPIGTTAAGSPVDSQGLIKSIRDTDLPAAAATLSHGNPSLQYVFVTNSGYIDESVHDAREQWLQDGGWRMLGRGDGEMGMEELDSETAKLIIVREEMDLTAKDKRRVLYQ